MSRVPLEQMMASLRPLSSVSNCGTITGPASVTVMIFLRILAGLIWLLDAAVRLGQACDVGHFFGRLSGEEFEQVLHRYSAGGRDPADGRCFAFDGVVVAEKVDGLPVRIGEGDTDIGGQRLAQIVSPFGGVGEKSLVVDVDLAATQGGSPWFPPAD